MAGTVVQNVATLNLETDAKVEILDAADEVARSLPSLTDPQMPAAFDGYQVGPAELDLPSQEGTHMQAAQRFALTAQEYLDSSQTGSAQFLYGNDFAGSEIYTVHSGGQTRQVDLNNSQSVQAELVAADPEFLAVFDEFPQSITVTDQDRVLNWLAYQQQPAQQRKPVSEIRTEIKHLWEWRLKKLHAQPEIALSLPDYFFGALGMLVNGAHDQYIAFRTELDNAVFHFDIAELEEEQQEIMKDLPQLHHMAGQNVALIQRVYDDIVGHQMNLGLAPMRDTGGGMLVAQNQRIEQLHAEQREYNVDLQIEMDKITQIRKEMFNAKYCFLTNTGQTEEVDKLLIQMSLHPESVPEKLQDKVDRLTGFNQLMTKSTTEQLQVAVSQYNTQSDMHKEAMLFQDPLLSRVLSEMKKPERQWFEMQSTSFLEKNADLVDMVNHPIDGWRVIHVTDSYQSYNDFRYIRKTNEGSLVVAKIYEGRQVVTEKVYKPEEYQEYSDYMDPVRGLIKRIIHEDDGYKDLARIGNELSEHIGPLVQLLNVVGEANISWGYVRLIKEHANELKRVWDANESQIRALLAKYEPLMKLKALGWAGFPEDQEIIQMVEAVDGLDSLVKSHSIEKLYEAGTSDKLTAKNFTTWFDQEGVIIIGAIAGGVLAMTGVGAIIGGAAIPTILSYAMCSVATGVGGYVGQELAKGLSHYHQSDLNRFLFTDPNDEENHLDAGEYFSRMATQIATSSTQTFMFMCAGNVVGQMAQRLTASQHAAMRGFGNSLLRCGGYSDKLMDLLMKSESLAARFIKDFIGETIEEVVEGIAEGISSNAYISQLLSKLVTLLSCTRGGIGSLPVVKNGHAFTENGEIALHFSYAQGTTASLLAQLSEQYSGVEGAAIYENDGVIEVEIAQASGPALKQVYAQSVMPHGLRSYIMCRLGADHSLINYASPEDHLMDLCGIAVTPEGGFHVSPETSMEEAATALRELGFLVFEKVDPQGNTKLVAWLSSGQRLVIDASAEMAQERARTESSSTTEDSGLAPEDEFVEFASAGDDDDLESFSGANNNEGFSEEVEGGEVLESEVPRQVFRAAAANPANLDTDVEAAVEPATFSHDKEMEIKGLCEADAEQVGADVVTAGDNPDADTVRVSKGALFSYGYMNCRGILMVQGDQCALCHILADADVEPFIQNMLESFDSAEPIQVYLLEAADYDYTSDAQEECERLGLSVMEKFVRTDATCSNCLFVDPQTGQVIHYDKAGRHSYSWHQSTETPVIALEQPVVNGRVDATYDVGQDVILDLINYQNVPTFINFNDQSYQVVDFIQDGNTHSYVAIHTDSNGVVQSIRLSPGTNSTGNQLRVLQTYDAQAEISSLHDFLATRSERAKTERAQFSQALDTPSTVEQAQTFVEQTFGAGNVVSVTSHEEGVALLEQARDLNVPFEMTIKHVVADGQATWVVQIGFDTLQSPIGSEEYILGVYQPTSIFNAGYEGTVINSDLKVLLEKNNQRLKHELSGMRDSDGLLTEEGVAYVQNRVFHIPLYSSSGMTMIEYNPGVESHRDSRVGSGQTNVMTPEGLVSPDFDIVRLYVDPSYPPSLMALSNLKYKLGFNVLLDSTENLGIHVDHEGARLPVSIDEQLGVPGYEYGTVTKGKTDKGAIEALRNCLTPEAKRQARAYTMLRSMGITALLDPDTQITDVYYNASGISIEGDIQGYGVTVVGSQRVTWFIVDNVATGKTQFMAFNEAGAFLNNSDEVATRCYLEQHIKNMGDPQVQQQLAKIYASFEGAVEVRLEHVVAQPTMEQGLAFCAELARVFPYEVGFFYRWENGAFYPYLSLGNEGSVSFSMEEGQYSVCLFHNHPLFSFEGSETANRTGYHLSGGDMSSYMSVLQRLVQAIDAGIIPEGTRIPGYNHETRTLTGIVASSQGAFSFDVTYDNGSFSISNLVCVDMSDAAVSSEEFATSIENQLLNAGFSLQGDLTEVAFLSPEEFYARTGYNISDQAPLDPSFFAVGKTFDGHDVNPESSMPAIIGPLPPVVNFETWLLAAWEAQDGQANVSDIDVAETAPGVTDTAPDVSESPPIIEIHGYAESSDPVVVIHGYTDLQLEPSEASQDVYRSQLEMLNEHVQPDKESIEVGIQVDDITAFRGEFFTQAVKELLGDSGVTQVRLTVHDAKTGQDITCAIDVAKGTFVTIESPALSVEEAKTICAQVLGEAFASVQETTTSWDQTYQNNFWQAAAKYYQRSSSASLSATPTLGKGTSLLVINPITEAEIKTELQTYVEQAHEFISSLQAPLEPGSHSRRINASKQDVIAFLETYPERPADWDQHTSEQEFMDADGELKTYFMPDFVMGKLDAWILQSSHDVTTEVSGYFVTKKHDGGLMIVDFLPQASLSESVEYRRDQLTKTHGRETADKRIGQSQIDSLVQPKNSFVADVIGFEAFNPLQDAQYRPEGLTIPVHNHFLDSQYQTSPSVTDWKGRKSVEAVRTPQGGLIFYRRGGVVGQDQAVVTNQTIDGVATEEQTQVAEQFITQPRIQAEFHHQTRQATDGFDTEFEVWENVKTGEIAVLSGEQGRANTGRDVLVMSEDAVDGIETETTTNDAQEAFKRKDGWVYRGHAHPVGEGYTVEPSADDILRFMQEGLTEHYIFQHDPSTGETHWACLNYDAQGEVVVGFSQETLVSEKSRTLFEANRLTALQELETNPELRAPAAMGGLQVTYQEGDSVLVKGYESMGAFRVAGVINGRVVVVNENDFSLIVPFHNVFQDQVDPHVSKQRQLIDDLRTLEDGAVLSFDEGLLYFTFVDGQLYVNNPEGQAGILIMSKQGIVEYFNGACIRNGHELEMSGEWFAVNPGEQVVVEDMRFKLPTHESLKDTAVVAPVITSVADQVNQNPASVSQSHSAAETTSFFRITPTASTTLTLNPEFKADIHAGNVLFSSTAKMPNGEKLTFEKIQEMGLTPQTQLDVEGQTVWISKMYIIDNDGRMGTVAYVQTDDGKWAVRSYYKSKSHMGWRLLTHYRRTNNNTVGWYGKGYQSDSVMLPISTQMALYEAVANQKDEGYELEAPVEERQNVFAGTARPIGMNVPLYENLDPNMSFLIDVSLSSELLSSSCFHVDQKRHPDPSQIHPGSGPNSELEPADFTKPESSFEIEVDMYGLVKGEVFTSRDGSLRYLFLRDQYDRVWIGSVEKTDAAVSSHGVYKTWVDAGALATPAYEYFESPNREIEPEYANDALTQDGYADTFDKYLRHIPLIRRYFQEKGLAMPTSESLSSTSQAPAHP
jgi:hypothetical protein